jgi:hypothetical protein
VGRFDRARGILASARRDAGDDVARKGVERLERAAPGGVDPLAADELTTLLGAGLRLLLLQFHRFLLRQRVQIDPINLFELAKRHPD